MTENTTAHPIPEPGADELERFALEECIKRQKVDHQVTVLVSPVGHYELALRFAQLGAHVSVADDESLRKEVEQRALAAGLADKISFLPDTALDGQAGFDIVFIRRGMSNMPYREASQRVRHRLRNLKIGGKLYVSVLGLHSELGDGYSPRELPVEQRFEPLGPVMARKYELHSPVCLYTERNLFMLFLEAGASVLRTLTTTYGNVQGIAVRV